MAVQYYAIIATCTDLLARLAVARARESSGSYRIEDHCKREEVHDYKFITLMDTK